MSDLSATRLEKIKKDVVDWYFEKRQMLIKHLEADGYPYGSVKLTPVEQLIRYKNLTAEDWQVIIERLYDRFRGLPDASTRVSRELESYRGQMDRLDREFTGAQQPFFMERQ
jgi:hypothetical protein